MPRHPSLAVIALVLAISATAGSAAAPAEWKEVKHIAGAFADSSVGTGARRAAGGITHAFTVEGKSIRFNWETKTAGRNPDFRLDVSMEVSRNNGGKVWQRVSSFGRTHQSGKDGKALDSGPGSYRVEIIGHAMEYSVVIDQLVGDKGRK